MTKPKVIFTEKNHSYSLNKRGEDVVPVKLTSVTQFIEKFKEKFNKNFWSSYKAYEKLIPQATFTKLKKTYGYNTPELLEACAMLTTKPKHDLARQSILEEWAEKTREALEKGTAFHDHKEAKTYLDSYTKNLYNHKCYPIGKGDRNWSYANNSLKDNLYELEDGVYPELLVWDEEAEIAGQIDKVFISTIGNTRFVDINDYKTNKEITFTSFKGKKMEYPFNKYMDCNFYHYCIQVSMYAYFLEQFGFKPRQLVIEYKEEIIELPYLKNSIIKALDYVKKSTKELLPT